MTFDERYQREAEALFAARARLEISNGRTNAAWEPLFDERLRKMVFADPGRAHALAGSSGVRLNDGRCVRFEWPSR